MNYYQIAFYLIAILNVFTFLIARDTFKKIIMKGLDWKNEAELLRQQLETVNNQYRQLARILEALKSIKK